MLDRVDLGAEHGDRRRPAADARRAGARGGAGAAVPETRADDGLLPRGRSAPVADFLTRTATDPATRSAALAATCDGAVADVVRRSLEVADAADEQRAAGDACARPSRTPTPRRRGTWSEATSDGSLLRGEVLARWQDVVGTSELFRSLEQGVSRLRDRVVAASCGGSVRPSRHSSTPSRTGSSAVIRRRRGRRGPAHAAWRHDPAGAALLDGLALSRASADLRSRVAEQVRGWQGDVLALVENEGADRRTTARALSYGVNALGAVLMVAVFASTGGLTGAEIGITAGAAVLAQRLLEAVFGDDAVRRLTREAHERLDERVRACWPRSPRGSRVQLDASGAAGQDGGGPAVRLR